MAPDEPVTVLQAVGSFIGTIKRDGEDLQAVQRDLNRFVQWCGPDRRLAELSPPEMGEYAEQIGSAGNAAERVQIVKSFLSYARKRRLIDGNLAQHVRVRRSKSSSRRAQTAVSAEPVELTREGLARLQDELKRLKAERPPWPRRYGGPPPTRTSGRTCRWRPPGSSWGTPSPGYAR